MTGKDTCRHQQRLPGLPNRELPGGCGSKVSSAAFEVVKENETGQRIGKYVFPLRKSIAQRQGVTNRHVDKTTSRRQKALRPASK